MVRPINQHWKLICVWMSRKENRLVREWFTPLLFTHSRQHLPSNICFNSSSWNLPSKLGINDLASSTVSKHRLANWANSNLCSFFCCNRLRTAEIVSRFLNLPNCSQKFNVLLNTSLNSCSSADISFCCLRCWSSMYTSLISNVSAFSNWAGNVRLVASSSIFVYTELVLFKRFKVQSDLNQFSQQNTHRIFAGKNWEMIKM